jgi:hypothetical protein
MAPGEPSKSLFRAGVSLIVVLFAIVFMVLIGWNTVTGGAGDRAFLKRKKASSSDTGTYFPVLTKKAVVFHLNGLNADSLLEGMTTFKAPFLRSVWRSGNLSVCSPTFQGNSFSAPQSKLVLRTRNCTSARLSDLLGLSLGGPGQQMPSILKRWTEAGFTVGAVGPAALFSRSRPKSAAVGTGSGSSGVSGYEVPMDCVLGLIDLECPVPRSMCEVPPTAATCNTRYRAPANGLTDTISKVASLADDSDVIFADTRVFSAQDSSSASYRYWTSLFELDRALQQVYASLSLRRKTLGESWLMIVVSSSAPLVLQLNTETGILSDTISPFAVTAIPTSGDGWSGFVYDAVSGWLGRNPSGVEQATKAPEALTQSARSIAFSIQ